MNTNTKSNIVTDIQESNWSAARVWQESIKCHEPDSMSEIRRKWLGFGNVLNVLRGQNEANQDFGKVCKEHGITISSQKTASAMWLAKLSEDERNALYKKHPRAKSPDTLRKYSGRADTAVPGQSGNAEKITGEKPKTPEPPKMEIVDPAPEKPKARRKQSEVGHDNWNVKKARERADKYMAENKALKKKMKDFDKEVHTKALEMIEPSVKKLEEDQGALQKDKIEFVMEKMRGENALRERVEAVNKQLVDMISWTFDMDAKRVIDILTQATHPDREPSVEKRTKAQALLNEARRRLFPK